MINDTMLALLKSKAKLDIDDQVQNKIKALTPDPLFDGYVFLEQFWTQHITRILFEKGKPIAVDGLYVSGWRNEPLESLYDVFNKSVYEASITDQEGVVAAFEYALDREQFGVSGITPESPVVPVVWI